MVFAFFFKDYFRKNAEQTEKVNVTIIGGGYDICLFDVAAGGLCVRSKNEFFFFRK